MPGVVHNPEWSFGAGERRQDGRPGNRRCEMTGGGDDCCRNIGFALAGRGTSEEMAARTFMTVSDFLAHEDGHILNSLYDYPAWDEGNVRIDAGTYQYIPATGFAPLSNPPYVYGADEIPAGGELIVQHEKASLGSEADGGGDTGSLVAECGCAVCGGNAPVVYVDPLTGEVVDNPALEFSASGIAASPVAAVQGTLAPLGQNQSAITVSFLDAGDISLYAEFAYVPDWTGEQNWSNSQKAIVLQALDDIEDFLDVTFVIVGDGQAADLQFLKNNNVDSLGTTGSVSFTGPTPYTQAAVKINHTIDSRWGAGREPGGQGYETLVHEIGHALGLGHTHDESLGSDYLPGMSAVNAFTGGPDGINDPINSIMAYRDGWAEMGTSTLSYGNRANFGAWDVQALLNIYGASGSTNAGATTYTLPNAAAQGSYFETIIDTGGNDTIAAPTTSMDVVIDLRAATLDFDPETTGGPVSYVALSTPVGGFTIASGSVIENAVGSNGDDTLRGNTASNDLTGGNGADLFRGTAEEFDGDTITDAEIGDAVEILGLSSVTDVEFIEAGATDILRITSGSSIYEVSVEGLGGSSAYDIDLTLTEEGVLVSFDTAVAGVGDVEGVVFHDLDLDGVQDPGEAGFEGWTVFVDANANGALDGGELTTETDADGYYLFNDLPEGATDIGVFPLPGYVSTSSGGFTAASTATLPEFTITGRDVMLHTLGIPGDTVRELDNGETFTPSLTETGDLVGLDEFFSDPRFSGIDGSGYTVVVLDTGIDMDHPFFGPDMDNDGVADRIVYTADFTGSVFGAEDVDGHGTHVSSVAASSDGTYTGAAPGANIIHLKVLGDDGSGSGAWLEQALQWVATNAEAYNIVAVNMSLGFGDNSAVEDPWFLNDELSALKALGIINLVAAGNDFFSYQTQGAAYPASDPASIGVGAVYDAEGGGVSFIDGAISFTRGPDEIAVFSQRSTELTEIFAPGGAITAAAAGGGTATYYGTSQASPLVAGIAVLAQQMANQFLGRSLTFDEFEALIQDTGVTIYDGDDEDDNVTNTEEFYKRIDVMALAETILAMSVEPVTQTVNVLEGMTVDADFGFVEEGANLPPQAQDDSLSTDEDSALTGVNVLDDNGSGADSDPNGDGLTITEVNGQPGDVGSQIMLPSGALLTVGANGAVSYDPNGQFEGLAAGETDTDSFTYTVSDGNGGVDTATATVTINGVNDDPAAVDDEVSTDEATDITSIFVLDNDTDPDTSDSLTVDGFDTTGTLGIVTYNGDGTFDYDPNGAFDGLDTGETATDTFTYTVTDGNGGTDTATVTVTINGADDENSAPVGVIDLFMTDEDTRINDLDVLSNDDDPDGDMIEIIDVNQNNTAGWLKLNPDGTFDYNPNRQFESLDAGETAVDSFTYTISDGNGGTDTVTVNITITGVEDEPGDVLTGDENPNSLTGYIRADMISGLGGDDTLRGGIHDDTLDGGADNDRLQGQAGNDTIFGGTGVDTVNGGNGDDYIEGGDDNDYLNGNDGSDTIHGGLGDDFFSGGSQDDFLYGDEGEDRLFGNNGDDYIEGGDGADLVSGIAGDDFLYGGNEDDNLIGGAGNDDLHGEAGNDELSGNGGDDTIDGGLGDDRAFAGGDNDSVKGGAGLDTLFGNEGDDTIEGEGDRDRLFGNDGNDLLDGGGDNDRLDGQVGNDSLLGGEGNDYILGSGGDDTIFGGEGDDTLFGGSDDDLFVFSGVTGTDVISDFTAGAGSEDVIELSGYGSSLDEFSEVLAAASDDGTNTTIDLGGGNVIILENVVVADLHEDDFTFTA